MFLLFFSDVQCGGIAFYTNAALFNNYPRPINDKLLEVDQVKGLNKIAVVKQFQEFVLPNEKRENFFVCY